MKRNKRPLIWANCDDSGMLLDPKVGQHFLSGGTQITQSDIDYFEKNWNTPVPWEDFRKGASKHLQFRYLNYFERAACADAEKDDNNIIIGLDGNGNCVYF